ncbi:MAG: hypothetical protein H6827_10655 [Planctomycetes bacterium]|nr:hypothetical protein [Planctomycetota bacterium]
MKPPKHNLLLTDLLAEDSLETVRCQSLERGVATTRRRRRRARWVKGVVAASAVVTVLGLLVPRHRDTYARKGNPESVPAPSTVVVTQSTVPGDSEPVRFISDEELLVLLADRSLALIGPPGRKEVVFLDQPELDDDGRPGAGRPQ